MRPARLLTLFAFAAAACSGRLEVAELSFEPAPAELGDVEAAARRAFESHPGFRLREGARRPGAWQAHVRADLLRRYSVGPDEAEVVAGVELSRPGKERERLAGQGRRRSAADEAALAAALAGALEEALGAVVFMHEAAGRSDEEFIRDLSSKAARVRETAVMALARRRNPAALPALLDRLSDPDPEVMLSALGALVELGDRRAVLPIIEKAKGRDPELVVQLAYAIAELGGEDAEAWLFTQAAGAEDVRVRGAAREASAELQRRAEASGRRR